MKVLALLLSLSLLVVTHELGHLCFAKLFKTRVRRFYLFFNWGFSIFKAKKFNGKWHFLFFNVNTPEEWDEKNLSESDKNNTLWGIGWLPLGGYCDIAGMVDENKKADELPEVPQPWEYRTKPAWQRLCIISGGVLVNFLSALLIYSFVFAHWGKDELPMQNATLGYEYDQILLDEGFQNGDIIYTIDGDSVDNCSDAQRKLLVDKPNSVALKRGDSIVNIDMSNSNITERVNKEQPHGLITNIRMPFVVKDFVPGSPAKDAGIMVGDSVVSLDGIPMTCYSEISTALQEKAGNDICVGLYRTHADSLVYVEIAMQLPSDGKMGVQLKSANEVFQVSHVDYNLFQAVGEGVKYGWKTLVEYVSSLKILFTKGGTQSLGGFITMGSIFPKYWDWQSFWEITALLAVILAFMNIIPIPGLDGAYIVFTIWEIITHRKVSDKVIERANTVGFILLMLLLLLANGNDVWRLIRGWF
ncbi:MAG: RIP metalloprotease RseP [Bacteroidales bacterium]|nr:RIP metalloprotease RseP [Candidatus Colimorpha onthohippi]